MIAFKCDACKKYFDGELFVEISWKVYTVGKPPEMHLCTKCAEILRDLIEKNEKVAEKGEI